MAPNGDETAQPGIEAPPIGEVGKPKLRYVDTQWVEHNGGPYLHLRDRLGLSEKAILVPRDMAPLLALCDGTRDVGQLQAGMALRTGLQLSLGQVRDFVAGMDEALLLEGGVFERASEEALRAYREAPFRRPSHADLVYPSDAEGLSARISGFVSGVTRSDTPRAEESKLVGMVCPHIDYERGGRSYAQLFERCCGDLAYVEEIVIFGTDHSGSGGTLTPTRQSYATPHGVLPTDTETVDGLAEAIGGDGAFAEELHHVNEHSIELALVWLHHYMDGRGVPVVPVLCGSFHPFVAEDKEARGDETISAALDYLRNATADRRTLVVAAADLAHIGPSFGDRAPVDGVGKARLASEDAASIRAICDGDAEAFLALSRAESDARRICGLSPIYMTLRLSRASYGESLGYAQCPADTANGSWVSVVGALLYDEARTTIGPAFRPQGQDEK